MKLLIADDEDYTREGLIEAIPWSNYGISEIMQARDGKEALEISKWFKPDIVLTDIKMPKLSGIEFAEQLIKLCPNSKILFMSAYLEINYLKSAIKLSAVEYIEKPINLEIVEKALKKAVEFIHELRKQNVNNVENIELKKQKLANLLHYKNKDTKLIYSICEKVGYAIESNYLSIIIEDIKRMTSVEESINRINKFWEQNDTKSICAHIEEGRYLTIIEVKNGNIRKFSMLCEKLLEQEKSFCIGIGTLVNSLMDVSESFEMAMLNIIKNFYNLDKRLFICDDKIRSLKNLDPDLYVEFKAVMKNSHKNLYQWVEELFVKICKDECYKKEYIQSLFISLSKIILQDKKIIFTKLENMYNEEDVEKYIMNTTSIFQVRDFMFRLIKEYEAEVDNGSKYSKLVRDVIDYIDRHCSEVDFGVEDIAEYTHFSSAHLSVIFKHETGITLKQYIGYYRLELSKKLLSNEHYKITEIAELCGYSNANYFAKVFKAATTLSPIEFRKSVTNQ